MFDIAMQEYGNVQAVIDVALANNISITSLLVPGQELIIPTSQYENKQVLAYFSTNKMKPATAAQPLYESGGVLDYLYPQTLPLL